MSKYNQVSDIQYARFQILHVDLHSGLIWSAMLTDINYFLYSVKLPSIMHMLDMPVTKATF